MKRQLDSFTGESARKKHLKSLPSLCKVSPSIAHHSPLSDTAPREEFKSPWTPEEDQLIASEAAKSGSKNWKVISKSLNHVFRTHKRTPAECEARWNSIGTSSWTVNDELGILLAVCGGVTDWSSLAALFPTPKNPQLHLIHMVADTANRAKSRGYTDLAAMSPLQLMQMMVCDKLLFEVICEHGGLPEVMEVVQQTQLEEGHCQSLLEAVGKLLKPDKLWNKAALDQFLDDALEKIGNSIQSSEPDGLDSIMHVRQNEPMAIPANMMGNQYLPSELCWLPVSYIGQGYYVLALCYANPQQL